MNIIELGKKTLQTEAQTLLDQIQHLDQSFEDAINLILQSKGKLVVTGMGKSGIVGSKMAATFASTGTPSFFLHPGEAYHGDLGMVEKNDVVLALSFSGETDEVLKIIPFFQTNGNAVVSITGNKNSTLAKNSNIHLELKVANEACPLSLAPTSSTTVTMAMGDAMAVALMETKKFQPEDFARFHPGGALGRRLLIKVKDILRSTNLPIVSPDSDIVQIIDQMGKGRLGLTMVLDNEKVIGVITDGDLRRLFEAKAKDAFDIKASQIMTSNPKKILSSASLTEAENLFLENKINSLIVENDHGVLEGVVQIYDLNKH